MYALFRKLKCPDPWYSIWIGRTTHAKKNVLRENKWVTVTYGETEENVTNIDSCY